MDHFGLPVCAGFSVCGSKPLLTSVSGFVNFNAFKGYTNVCAMNKLKQFLFVYWDDNFLLDVVHRLKDNEGEFLRITALGNIRLSYMNSSINIIDYDNLFRQESVGLCFDDCKPVVLDQDLIREFSECKDYFFNTIDRVFVDPVSVRKQLDYFYELLSWFLGYFDRNNTIDAVIFDASPHMPWDIVLFFAARYYGIKTIILRRTLISNRVVLDTDFRVEGTGIICFKEGRSFLQGENVDLDQESFWIKHSVSVNKKTKDSVFSNKLLVALAYLPLLLKFVATNHLNYKAGYLKIGFFRLLYKMIRQKFKVIDLDAWMRTRSVVPDYTSPYIYFPLHFQPERSTDPEAGVFTSQFLALRMLSHALPEGWRIYVKEHPRQLNPFSDIRYGHFRSVEDYERIAGLPRVNFVPLEIVSSELISNCTMTATCTGSTVWEGMLQGKPGIAFGRVWHSECGSTITVTSNDQLQRAILTLVGQSADDVASNLYGFIEKIKNSLICSVNYEAAALASGVDRDILVKNLADAIVSSVE